MSEQINTQRSAGERRLLGLLDGAVATIKAKTLLVENAEQSKALVEQKLNKALADAAEYQKSANSARAQAAAMAQINATNAAQLAEASTTISELHKTINALRAHVSAYTEQMEEQTQAFKKCRE